MTRRHADAQSFTLLIAAVVAAAAAMSGFDRGWATGHDADYHVGGSPWVPGGDLRVSLGWWNTTSTLKTKMAPTEIELKGDAAQGLGAVACVLLGLSALFALNLLYSSLVDDLYPSAWRMDDKTEGFVTAITAGLIFGVSVVLYIALAYGANRELKKQFSAGLMCYPDWAFFFAIVSAVCWAVLTHATRSASRLSGPMGYLPI